MITTTGLDDLMARLDKLADQSQVEDIAKKAVNKAQPISEKAMKSAISSAESAWGGKTDIASSVSSTKAQVNAYGAYAVARPTGYHISKNGKHHVRNGELAAYLQYGSGGTGAKSPHPWREKAASSAEGECIEIMEEVVRQEMELE